jgi:DNA polymerase-3 subunit epsilon
VLLDRRISAHEADQLVGLASVLEIGHDSAARLHQDYFDSLVKTAWADGVLTVDEIADLATVAKLLDIPAERVTAALQPPATSRAEPAPTSGSVPAFALAEGDLIVLTGEMSRPRDTIEVEIRAHGYVPWSAVTKKVKLVVAADPDSLSGKARKARDYGIPIVGEDWLVAHLR